MRTFAADADLEAYVAERIQARIDALPDELTQLTRSDGTTVVAMSYEVFSVYRRAVTTTEELSPDQLKDLWGDTEGNGRE